MGIFDSKDVVYCIVNIVSTNACNKMQELTVVRGLLELPHPYLLAL